MTISPSFNWKLRSAGIGRVFALIAALVIPSISIVIANPFQKSNEPQFALMNYVLNNSKKAEAIFDGNSAYVFRNQAYYYGSLVEGIRERIAAGEISSNIEESLTNNRCRMVIDDDRVSSLPANFQKFFRNNYVVDKFPNVYIAGKDLGPENIDNNRAIFHIDLPLTYRIETNTKTFWLDGKATSVPVFLAKGTHRIEANQNLTYVKLRGY